jgi:uncharacterized cupredoxin-like copper-binding protein
MTSQRSTRKPRNPLKNLSVPIQRVLRGACWATAVCLSAATVAAAPQSGGAITLVLTDHHFRLTAPVERGKMVWHVKNDGTEPHQALVVKLPDGVNEYQERAWFEHGSPGPEPGEPMGGLKTLAPGAEASFETDLKPGKYLLLCTMAEEDGRHYELGMIYRFEIE